MTFATATASNVSRRFDESTLIIGEDYQYATEAEWSSNFHLLDAGLVSTVCGRWVFFGSSNYPYVSVFSSEVSKQREPFIRSNLTTEVFVAQCLLPYVLDRNLLDTDTGIGGIQNLADPISTEIYSPFEAGRPLSELGATAPVNDPLSIAVRLEGLKVLKDGWADGMQPSIDWGEGYGKAPSADGLDWLAGQFVYHYAASLPRPYLYPTPESGVEVEWSVGPHRASLEIDLETRRAEWHCLNLSGGDSCEHDLDLNLAGDWVWLSSQLRRLESEIE